MSGQAKLPKARHHRHMRHDGKTGKSNLLAFIRQQASRLGGKATANDTFPTNPTNGQTVTIAGKVYTFLTALVNADGNVTIGATAAASATNLFNAINATGGVPGTDYAAAMTANPSVTATNPVASQVTVTAKSGGLGGNSIAQSTTVTGATVPATLAGGTNFDTWTALHKYSATRIRSATSAAQLP